MIKNGAGAFLPRRIELLADRNVRAPQGVLLYGTRETCGSQKLAEPAKHSQTSREKSLLVDHAPGQALETIDTPISEKGPDAAGRFEGFQVTVRE